MGSHLLDETKILRVIDATAAGSTDVNGTGVDTAGWDGVCFVALLGTLTATQVTALHAQYSDDNAVADDYTDVAGSSAGPMGDDDDTDMLSLDILRPAKRYVRPVLDRATANAVVDGVIAILYRAREVPTTPDARMIDSVKLVHPAEGTP